MGRPSPKDHSGSFPTGAVHRAARQDASCTCTIEPAPIHTCELGPLWLQECGAASAHAALINPQFHLHASPLPHSLFEPSTIWPLRARIPGPRGTVAHDRPRRTQNFPPNGCAPARCLGLPATLSAIRQPQLRTPIPGRVKCLALHPNPGHASTWQLTSISASPSMPSREHSRGSRPGRMCCR